MLTQNLNREKFFYTKSTKETNAINCWFCFPAEYTIGMSSLGFLHLYKLLDINSKINVERIFLDSTKTSIPLRKLDLISFSFSFEFDFINIFKMLEKYNIPIFSEERNDIAPLIMGGGAVLTANPEPFYNIFDFIIIGDGEEVVIEITDILYNNQHLTKLEKLHLLSKIEGVYVPQLQNFSEIKRRIFISKNCISSPIVTDNTAFSDSFLIEICRGCPFSCNFCLTSHINKPVHYPSLNSIQEALNTGLEKCSTIGLLGALVPANPCFEELCEYILALRKTKEFKVAIGSLRADFISDLNIRMLTECGQKNTTIAVEAGSQKMRDFINKKLTEEQILKAVDTCYKNGLEGIKIYAMVGFPNETQEDIEELLILMKKIKQGKKLTLSVNSFVPKKFTPFEHYKMENIKTLEKKINYLKKECHKSGIAFRPSSLAWNEVQGTISTGDRNLAEKLFAAYKSGFTLGAFKKVLREK